MPEFLTLVPPEEALQRLLDHLPVHIIPEQVETAHALGRVTVGPVIASYPLPSFPRSTVDGYAVRAVDTYGASENLPAFLKLEGEVVMGKAADFSLLSGQGALIHTGGMLPGMADAVVMIEHTQCVRPGEIEVYKAASVGENIIKMGEDVSVGQEVIRSGVRLRPAEIGGLAALGLTDLPVARMPRVGILSSGDEVVPLEAVLKLGQVYDVNTYTLSTLVEQTGGVPVWYGIIPDRVEDLQQATALALEACDMVVITAGSSASTRDLTAEVIKSLGKPGVLVHGVNIRPGKPTILAVCQQKAVIGLPGNPVSALVIAGLFVVPVIEKLLGLEQPRPQAMIPARLTINLPSQAGREDWIPVCLRQDPGGYLVEPVFGKSNLIFTLVRADGLVRIPQDTTGLHAGETVMVTLMR